MMALLRAAWERVSIYLPLILMGLLALGTYWLVRNAPMLGLPEVTAPVRHEPDYFMREFSIKTFDATGRLKSEILGVEARHYPDTDTIEIDKVRIRSINPEGRVTNATANRGLSNADGSEVQLFGNAVVTRQATTDAAGRRQPQLEFRGEFLHAFSDAERVTSNKPVTLIRDNDRFTADAMDYDNLDRLMELRGRVRGVLPARAGK
ncbi:LPS export ABC transporter periplasmic protein LptC [Rhodoferax koreense]|uniref:LPS export ABC transporter periplasmic protein LptC n=1 Tax=Rhodoferax koreensis TaxID=1842727 RepID=A0A1P8K2W8_9BURK|nr:LPS export ABC transporter periplasmic protein LptC [Rhodoferax koreense]APW40352.1 LPS export ABC transporter periplasmic protein LptC [Rhodoferax koreense]